MRIPRERFCIFIQKHFLRFMQKVFILATQEIREIDKNLKIRTWLFEV